MVGRQKTAKSEYSIKSTVAKRLAFRVGIVGIILSVTAIAILIPLQRAKAHRDAISQGRFLSETLSTVYKMAHTSDEENAAQELLQELARMPDLEFINILDEKGFVRFSTEKDQFNRHYDLKQALWENNGLLYLIQPLSNPSERAYAVVVVLSLPLIYGELYQFYLILALGFCVLVMFLSLVVAWVAEVMVGTRLLRLFDVMKSAERGAFLARAEEDEKDEIGQLAAQFNQLLMALTTLKVKDLEREQELYQAQEQLAMKAQLERTADELSESNKQLERRVSEQELLMEAAHLLSGTLSKEGVIERLVSLIRDKLGWPDFAVFLVKEDKSRFLYLASASGTPNISAMQKATFYFGEGITGIVAQTGAPLVVPDLTKENRIKLRLTKDEQASFLSKGSMLCVPMVYQGKVRGVMDFFCPEENAFDEEHVKLLHALSAQAAMAVANAELYEATLELAISDPLTGLMNRRSMQRRIENELVRIQRFPAQLAVLMVDVDHFKNYNDRMGHILGDQALKKIANCLKSQVRKVDGVARFGGEEFCVILPQTNEKSAIEVAEKLCGAVRQLELRGASEQPLGCMSVSIGISVYPKDTASLGAVDEGLELLRLADQALYEAKRQGRNRVNVFQGKTP